MLKLKITPNSQCALKTSSNSNASSLYHNHWIIDEEAAAVVRRYLAKQGLGTCRGSCDMSRPYTWTASTVSDLVKKPEYMGHTVNFRTRKESYKDKNSVHNSPEDWIIFENTQEAIVDEETWLTVQKIRETKHRPTKKANTGHIPKNTNV